MKYNEFLSIIILSIVIVLWATKVKEMAPLSQKEDNFKEYFIENSHRVYSTDNYWKKDNSKTWRLTCIDYYWEEITIKKTGDSSYYLIAWGKRDKRLHWYLFRDYDFGVDITYNRSKNKSVGLDEEIMRILNNTAYYNIFS